MELVLGLALALALALALGLGLALALGLGLGLALALRLIPPLRPTRSTPPRQLNPTGQDLQPRRLFPAIPSLRRRYR
ncbi:MAG: hypothetical protein ACYCQM_02995 [Acidithiobacillus sp.]